MIRLENVVTVWRSIVSNREDYRSVLLGVEEAASSNLVVPTIVLILLEYSVCDAEYSFLLWISVRVGLSDAVFAESALRRLEKRGQIC